MIFSGRFWVITEAITVPSPNDPRPVSFAFVSCQDINEGKLKFGELTFYPGGGEEKLRPEKWDRIFGAQWHIDGGATRHQR